MEKLNGSIQAAARVAPTANRDEAQASATPRSQSAGTQAEQATDVSLSPLAAGAASGGPPLDRERIEAVRSAIAAGAYPIDAAAIADRLIAAERT